MPQLLAKRVESWPLALSGSANRRPRRRIQCRDKRTEKTCLKRHTCSQPVRYGAERRLLRSRYEHPWPHGPMAFLNLCPDTKRPSRHDDTKFYVVTCIRLLMDMIMCAYMHTDIDKCSVSIYVYIIIYIYIFIYIYMCVCVCVYIDMWQMHVYVCVCRYVHTVHKFMNTF